MIPTTPPLPDSVPPLSLAEDAVQRLRSQILTLEGVLNDLRAQLVEAEDHLNPVTTEQVDSSTPSAMLAIQRQSTKNRMTFESSIDQIDLSEADKHTKSWALDAKEHKRYGRQLIMPEVGLAGQLALKNSSVLIVGVGGLGCPAATYLAGAGVGKIGLVDGDTVELSNLHRQLLHTENWVGLGKTGSAVENLRLRNSKLQYLAYPYSLTPQNAVQTMEGYDFILDCTDRPSSRYLISDAAVLATKPLITASALRTEGQLMVLNNPPKSPNNEGGSCYRCVFPKPPPAETVMTCGDGGILGPVVGVMGVLMAMETLKLLLPTPQRAWNEPGKLANANPPSLLLYSAYGSPPFRSVKLRGKKKGCPSCSDTATLTRAELSEGALDYDFFCGLKTPAQTSNHEPRISAAEYSEVSASPDNPHILVDVREKVQFDICHLKGSVNLPFSEISRDEEASISQLDGTINSDSKIADRASLYFICRYGNDSQVAVKKFKEAHTKYDIKGDIAGGLRAWRESVDPDFPEY